MKPISPIEVEARIAPASVRWPDTALHWEQLKDAVAEIRGLVLAVHHKSLAVEQDPELSADGINRRLTEIGASALRELQGLRAGKAAEEAVSRALALFEERMVDLPKAALTPADIALAQEVRSYVRQHKSPIDFVMANLSDPRVIGAVLHAPPYLSGLTPEAFNLVEQRARSTHHPEFVDQQKSAEAAVEHLRNGVRSAQKMIQARTGATPSA